MSCKQSLTILITVVACIVVGSVAMAADMPEQVTIDSMSEMFEGVEFDHTMHTELSEDCSVCHHHATGTGTVDSRCVSCHAKSDAVTDVRCSACHVATPFSAESLSQQSQDLYQFHIDRPGLKAAYHWNCLGCHAEMDGPMECVDCHSRTPKGDAFYHTNATDSSDEGGH